MKNGQKAEPETSPILASVSVAKQVLVNLDDVVRDNDVYPRQNISRATIDSYVEALKAGAVFPPPEIQRVRDNGSEKTICLDGWHRIEAYREYCRSSGKEIESIDMNQWRDEVVDKDKELVALMIRSAELNTRHGLRLAQGDVKHQLQKIALNLKDVPEKGYWKKLSPRLGITPEWASECVSDIIARKRMSRDAQMLKLSLLGWTQEEIGELHGVSHQAVSETASKLDELKLLAKSDFFEKKKPLAEIAEYYHLDPSLAWALVLEGKEDRERLRLLSDMNKGLDCNPRPYDVWNFSGSNDLFGYDYPGRIPGQLVLQLLYFYTKQGDHVVDPMAGSGTTLDACLVMDRKCAGFDINPTVSEKRPEIRTADAITAIQTLKHEPDLVFLDPPYYKKKEKEYSHSSISALDRRQYLEYFGKLADACQKQLAPDGHLAFLMSDYTEDDPTQSIFIHHYITQFEANGFILERIILSALSTEQFHPDIQIRFTRDRKLARLARYLLIFQRQG